MSDDGIIKFQYEFEKEDLKPSPIIKELIQYRNRAFQLGYIGVYEDGIGFGNISIRVNDGFLISGSATGSIALSNSNHFSKVDRWSVEENKIRCRGPLAASSESLTHAIIYDQLPEVNAVLHIHNSALWNRYYHLLPSTCSHIPYGTTDMAGAVRFLIRKQDGNNGLFLMKGHQDGLLAYAENMEELFQLFEDLK